VPDAAPVTRARSLLFGLVLLAFALRPAGAFEGRMFGRDGLWRVTHNICAPFSQVTGLPTPCLAVDRDKGLATLRAPDDATHIIVTPLTRISGVESPILLRPDAPNLWAEAWGQRGWVAQGAGEKLGWNALGMAINSRPGRSQDQLHIHVDCIKPEVRDALAQGVRNQKSWFDIDFRPEAGRYHAKRLSADDLNRNLFRMAALENPRASANRALQTIAVIGFEDSKAGRGFILLESGHGGSAEELLDHSCRLARG
jgi:CDP-diacylglycerol pyrophosphatase